ncbi:MAG: hypothetical protein R8G01_14015 [Ilumatobacteraceae bacterium]|nr:hypothetical protein [Ilumatobacteraceae bacterium]
MTVIEIPRAVLHRVQRRDETLPASASGRPALRRSVQRLKSHPGAGTSPYAAALDSVRDVRPPRW